MNKRLFTKIIKNLNSINFDGRISLYLMNEPFLDGRIVQLIDIVREFLPENRLNISTNGVLVEPKYIQSLLERGLTDCDVSCYTEEAWNKWKDENVNAIDMRNHVYNWNNRGGNIDAGDKEIGGYCERPFVQMYINAFGQAILCCSDYKFEVILGDCNKEKLEDIWNGKKYKEYRKKLEAGKRDGLKLCSVCNYT
jgi:MoaA/NifB/PqqE/SkfB family radical SAM enzyme